jgi:hypothetical protein
MSWRNEWQAISGHIRGFAASAQSFLQSGGSDTFSVARKQLLPQAKRIYDIIKKFKEDYEAVLPSQACECLSVLIKEHAALFMKSEPIVAGSEREDVQARLCILVSIQAELTYHLSDFSAIAKRMSERAFIHLQRSIVADGAVRERWCEAFEAGELACEKLGGTQLLLHGIWAFKVNAEGERTDLVFEEPLMSLSEVESAAEALVLTEWKLVRNPTSLESLAADAMKQAARYAAGVLAGLELAQYRYLVFVSKNVLQKMPGDQIVGEVTYRHINVAVNPCPPSKK